MEINKINAAKITSAVKKLFIDCNYYIGKDIENALFQAKNLENSALAKNVLTQLIKNNEIAAKEEVPICQDTGMAVLFVEYGDKIVIENGNFEEAVNVGVKQAYEEGFLRKSVVLDPLFDRTNTNSNTPCIIHTKIVTGTTIKITAGGKGFGSENMSAIKMFTPSSTPDDVKTFVLNTVKSAGPNPCPPIIVGVGIGGTFEKSAQLAKKATFRNISIRNQNKNYAEMELDLLNKINDLNIGAAGLGGKTTALAVNIETFPTHIAGLPVAVNICCHACRHKSIEIF